MRVIRLYANEFKKIEFRPSHRVGEGGRSRKGTQNGRLGSRNRTTVVAEALLRNEELELVRKAIEMAKAGDAQMLKFLLDRILPKNARWTSIYPNRSCF